MEEIASRAERTGVPQATKFLSMAEQSELLSMRLGCELFGGFEGAERRIAVFGADEAYCPPIACVRIAPANRRFAGELGHRDFLGALMALGITREVLGDIVAADGEGFLLCMESIAPFIIENLTEVGRTTVVCSPAEPPDMADNGGEEVSLAVASLRLDALVSAVYKLSREDAKALCERGLVFINSRLTEKAGTEIKDGDIISVRSKGRFVFLSVERETRKGKLRVLVKRY